MLDMEFQMTAYHRPPRKNRDESYYIGAETAIEIHDLLSRHHRAEGKGVDMPMGDITMTEGSEGALGWSGTDLQYLLDCTVPLKQQ